jgi:hypothetical protein
MVASELTSIAIHSAHDTLRSEIDKSTRALKKSCRVICSSGLVTRSTMLYVVDVDRRVPESWYASLRRASEAGELLDR